MTFQEPGTPQQTDTNSQDGSQVVSTSQPGMMTVNGQNVVFANNSFAQVILDLF